MMSKLLDRLLDGGSARSWRSEAQNWPLTSANREPPWGIEPQTYALRSAVGHDNETTSWPSQLAVRPLME